MPTSEERSEIAGRVTVIGERTILMREIPVQSPASVNSMFDRLESLADGWERFCYVADLTEAARPDAETRATLKRRVLRVSPRVAHVAIVVGNNLLMRAMARLVAVSMGLTSVSTHATRGEAIAEAARGLER